jgi:hypothetical protein
VSQFSGSILEKKQFVITTVPSKIEQHSVQERIDPFVNLNNPQ